MWVVAAVYSLYTIRKAVMLINNKLQTEKQDNYLPDIADISENIAIVFVLFFVALERIGIGLYISLIVMCLCGIVKRKINKT